MTRWPANSNLLSTAHTNCQVAKKACKFFTNIHWYNSVQQTCLVLIEQNYCNQPNSSPTNQPPNSSPVNQADTDQTSHPIRIQLFQIAANHPINQPTLSHPLIKPATHQPSMAVVSQPSHPLIRSIIHQQSSSTTNLPTLQPSCQPTKSPTGQTSNNPPIIQFAQPPTNLGVSQTSHPLIRPVIHPQSSLPIHLPTLQPNGQPTK